MKISAKDRCVIQIRQDDLKSYKIFRAKSLPSSYELTSVCYCFRFCWKNEVFRRDQAKSEPNGEVREVILCIQGFYRDKVIVLYAMLSLFLMHFKL